MNKNNSKQKKEKWQIIKEELLKRKDFKAYIKMQNVLALKRINYPDHGINHVRIVTNNALKIFELLSKRGIKTTTQIQHRFTKEDVKVILVLASMLHDLGMAIDREYHELLSVILASPIIEDILKKHYDQYKATILKSEILHAIFSHRRKGKPKTLEAEIVRLADGLDIAKGRASLLISKYSLNIHFVASFSIREVRLKEGKERPIDIEIIMEDSAGIFLVSEFLQEKIKSTSLENYVNIFPIIKKEKTAKNKK